MIDWSNAAMLRSLLINLAMLAATLTAVFWIGWSVPPAPPEEPRQSADEVAPSLAPATRSPEVVAPTGARKPVRDAKPVSAAFRGKAETKLDLNRATLEQFQQLPGIGPALAQRLIDHRHAGGPFRSVEDLRKVKGLGPKRIERLRPLVMVETVVRPTAPQRGAL